MSFVSNISSIRSKGSAKTGSAHWLAQRITAISLIFLVLYLVFSLIFDIAKSEHGLTLSLLVSSPFYVIALALLMMTAVYHANLGIQVVIEDYVQCKIMKYGMIIGIKIVSYLSVFAAIFAIIEKYFLSL